MATAPTPLPDSLTPIMVLSIPLPSISKATAIMRDEMERMIGSMMAGRFPAGCSGNWSAGILPRHMAGRDPQECGGSGIQAASTRSPPSAGAAVWLPA